MAMEEGLLCNLDKQWSNQSTKTFKERNYKVIILCFWVVLGLGLATYVYTGNSLSFKLNIVIFFIITLAGIFSVGLGSASLLSRLMIVLYSLPFISTIIYLVDDNYIWYDNPSVLFMIQDHYLQSVMIMLGTIGLAGLISGILLVSCNQDKGRRTHRNIELQQQERQGITPLLFYFLLAGALFLAAFSAPTKTIFEAAYASEGTASISESYNVNSAYAIAYVLIVMLFVDAQRDRGDRRRQQRKYAMIILTVIIIVSIFGILRGDRESIGLILALSGLYGSHYFSKSKVRTKEDRREFRKRILKISSILCIIIFVFSAVGALRSKIFIEEERQQANISQSAIEELKGGTWTAVLLTNLVMTRDYISGDLDYYYGQTYVDYFLSLPPGFITKALDYTRPLESTSGPAWWFQPFSAGGIHISLVPLKNFGIFGMFFIMALYGFFIAKVEIIAESGNWMHCLLYGSMFMVAPFWFWYGDMYLVRTLIMTWLAGILYKFITGIRA